MRLLHLTLLLVSLQGDSCIRFIAQRVDECCMLDYNENVGNKDVEIRDQDVTKICKVINYVEAMDYHYAQGIIYYIDHYSRVIKLKGFAMNSSAEEVSSSINIPRYARSKITDLAVDWIHDTFYLICDNNVFFAPALVSKEEIHISNITTPKEVGQVLGKGESLIPVMIVSVKLDPYEQSLFIMAQFCDDDAFYYKCNTYIFRSDLMGKGLKRLTEPVLTDLLYDLPLNADVGEKRLYIYHNSDLYMYNYEGQFLSQFYLEQGNLVTSFGVLGNSLFVTSPIFWKGIANVTINVTDQNHVNTGPKEDLKINTLLPHGMDGKVSVRIKVLDARVQRRKIAGKYQCEPHNCPELCEVWPSGDTCVCFKTKAKARDGVTCYECGQSNLTSLVMQTIIVNGTDAKLGNFPWHAVIYDRAKTQICGGTLISPRVVITAAHCVSKEDDIHLPTPVEAADITVALGKTRRAWNITEKNQQTRRVMRIVLHDKYGGGSLRAVNDLALLFLDPEVQYNNFVMPACLDYNLNQLPPHETLTGYVPGMGNTEECIKRKECTKMSETLQYVKVQVVPFDKCFKDSSKIEPTVHHMLSPDKFCIGNGTVSPVQRGDSGGGLTLVYNGLHYLTGVDSTKLINIKGNKYSFGAFTNVSVHMEWLKKNLPEDQ